MSENFYITFGQKYRREAHPSGYDISPDGVVQVVAPNYETARDIAVKSFGQEWSFIYPERYTEMNYYPLGVIMELR